MFNQLILWIRALFGKITGQRIQREIQESEKHKRRYEDISATNFTAIFANSLANKAVTDCNMIVTNTNDKDSKRSIYIRDTLQPIWDGIKCTASQALGKGGKFLIPYFDGHKIFVNEIDQDRCAINETNGADEIVSMSVIAEIKQINNNTYQRIVDYMLENGNLCIRTRIIDKDGNEVPADIVPEWAGITPELNIGNVDRMLVGYLKCPKDSRRDVDFYGVPITYGAEDTMRQIADCLHDYEQEFKLKRPFVGADEAMFGKNEKLPSDGLFKLFRGGGALSGSGSGGSFWEVFDPAFRDSSYGNRCLTLFSLLEKEVGTSKGILTELTSLGATATEIKSANHDTFCLVSDIRKNIAKCLEDVAYAVDVYAEFFGLTPRGNAGDYKITFDWDMSLIESSSETFEQLSELESRGLISGARLNSWATGQSMEAAQAEIEAVKEEQAKAAGMLLKPEDLEPERNI